MAETISKYGCEWPAGTLPIAIEMGAIRRGGSWEHRGKQCGMGLSHHYEAMRNILWPDLHDHRWHQLCRDEILKNKVTVLMGPGSCGKTHEASWIYLCEYFCFPEETCVLVSSTHIDGLRLRVWAEMTMLWQQAVDLYGWLPGHLLDSKLLLSTDSIEEDEFDERRVRDWRKGIKGIPCMQNGTFVGLGKYAGIKQKRMRLIADEAALMGSTFLSAFANLNKNIDFRAIVLGNPNDPNDPLGKAAEPLDGWSTHMEPDKTAVWKTRFMEGTCVNLIGTDSPNFDYPEDQPDKFPELISRRKIKETLSFFDKDSFEYYSQCIGSMKIGVLSRRVLTRDMCRQHRAQEDVTWKGTPLTRVYAVDAAYGGDRCVGGYVEFGEDIYGTQILNVVKPNLIPIKVGLKKEPEDQIADRVRADCETVGIPPENMGHDSTGRGSLGTAIARIWSAQTNPVEFGGKPTDRPVSQDMYIFDPKTKQRRLKLCSEHYSKFVTELWFSVRYAVEAGQVRNLPEDVMEEFCMRQWENVKDDKKEVETKEKMKERVGRSPDLADWLAICVEMARRRGFQIAKLANSQSEEVNLEWMEDLKRKKRELRESYSLSYRT